ncbi:LamB/YcsF family protein [Robertmurraya yapensis]|uniref:5-oxoprolinase subunit A n=1 Tax=Bacillus yapensis TaxID=2492960 RepID=A0A431VV13_9BACI|nr:5-oxoprolinase subunit PxpA [Bacillus yapensis]RTR27108.1 LamB/YcsF family protein [Bacillus yapensis]TKS93955.1 5-oxoprolinase subunit PxpA [Bacillus yapensis]
MPVIDLNCDMGESFGRYTLGYDNELMNYATSINIACGFHAGDPHTMRKTVQLALEKNIAIGAHPGLPDLNGFGRREMSITPQEAYELVIYQIGALNAFVQSEGGVMQHVKPHGALYNMAAKNAELSEAIAEAVYKVNPTLILFGLAGSELIKAGKRLGLRTANEAFADRTYQSDGTLTPRSRKDSLIHDDETALKQVTRMIIEGKIESVDGEAIPIKADTICLHGDGAHAVQFAKTISEGLSKAGITITHF